MVATEWVDLLAEPLLHNPHLCVQVAESPLVCWRLVLVRVTKIGDTLDYDLGGWVDPQALGRRMGLSTLTTPRRLLQEMEAALPPMAWFFLEWVLRKGAPHPPLTPGLPDLSISPLPREPSRPPPPRTLSWLHAMQPVRFRTASRDQLCVPVLHMPHYPTLGFCPDTKGQDLLPAVEGGEPQWASLKSSLVPRLAGNISWWLLHGAMSTGMYLVRFTSVPKTCPFRGVRETLAHAVPQCASPQSLIQLLQSLLFRVCLRFSLRLFIYAHLSLGPTKSQDHLVNLLLAMAKVAIRNTRERRLAVGGFATVEPVFVRLSVHVSGQSSSGQRLAALSTPSQSSGRCPGVSAGHPLLGPSSWPFDPHARSHYCLGGVPPRDSSLPARLSDH
ncbi:unnamed protein product [Eretmochelys imbricata]